ncbi:acyltransferase family protein [Butyrivibrio sp. AE2015]|uniref:acyltransferase family protein n=1 Tax=Butyrivibrio sp. AE2015 TaxID=1280663 RepID=UPI0003B67891|nr:acyltransferase family protein [Butyrivibrio sp. AE2015]
MDVYKSNSKNCTIELWRFIASVIIMTHHLYTTGIDSNYYIFHDGDIFVELFFLFTGFFTARHFMYNSYEDITTDQKVKTALTYSIRKFRRFFMPCAIATVFQYVLLICSREIDTLTKIKNLVSFPLDVLFLTEFYQRPLVTPLWYLSSMLITLPVVSFLMQSKNRLFHAMVSGIGIGIYYGIIIPRVFTPLSFVSCAGEDLLRAFVCLYSGCFLFETSTFISEIKLPILLKKLFPFVGNGCLLLVVLAASVGYITLFHSVCAFIAGAILILSFSRNKRTKLYDICFYLGRISLYIYIWNWGVGSLLKILCSGWDPYSIMICYYLLTFILSIITDIIVQHHH